MMYGYYGHPTVQCLRDLLIYSMEFLLFHINNKTKISAEMTLHLFDMQGRLSWSKEELVGTVGLGSTGIFSKRFGQCVQRAEALKQEVSDLYQNIIVDHVRRSLQSLSLSYLLFP